MERGNGDFCSDGIPHVTRIDRNKKGVGCELKNSADADTKIILQFDIQEGTDVMSSKEYMSEYKLASTALLLRLTKPWHGSGRAIKVHILPLLVSPQLLLVERMVCTLQD